MKLARFKTIAIAVIILGLLGGAVWVSRVPYQGDKAIPTPVPSPAPMPAAVPLKPIFVVITSPTNEVVGVPLIQLKGCFVGSISLIEYDVLNSEDCRTNQRQYHINWRPGPRDVTTNFFECCNLPLAKGTNLIVLHT